LEYHRIQQRWKSKWKDGEWSTTVNN